MSTCVCLLLFVLVGQIATSNVPELSLADFNTYIREEQWSQHGCILFYVEDEKHKRIFRKTCKMAFESHKVNMTFKMIQLKKISAEHTRFNNSFIKCYVGQNVPEMFVFNTKRKLSKWLKKVIKYHWDGIFVLPNKNVELLGQHDDDVIVVIAPGQHHFEASLKIFDVILPMHNDLDINTYWVPPGSKTERDLYDSGMIEMFPSVAMYWRKNTGQPLHQIVKLSGSFEVTEEFLKLHLLLHRMRELKLKPNQIELHMHDQRYLKVPVILSVYSSHSPSSYKMLHAPHRAVGDYLGKLKFIILDISESESHLVLSRYMQVYDISSLPFILCIYRNRTEQGRMQILQKSMNSSLVPTSHILEGFLQSLGLFTKKRRNYNLTCYQNQTNTCMLGGRHFFEAVPGNLHNTKKVQRMKKKTTARKKVQRSQLVWVTDASWRDLFLTKDFTSNVDIFHRKAVRQSRLVLMIFTNEDCSFCKIAQPEFEKVSSSAQYLDRVSVYMVECSKNSQICEEEHIGGYPTLILYRILPAYEKDHCLSEEYLREPVKTDYHGEFEADNILSWLSEHTLPDIQFLDGNEIPAWKDNDIHVTANLHTKSFVLDYLPRSLKDRLLPLKCFLAVCELLYSNADCFGAPESGSVLQEREEMFVSSVDFKRKDGAGIRLFKTNHLIERTLNEEQSTHFFQHKHKYDSGFTCEDDHARCTKVLLEFIIDHSRMPLTHVNTAMFHSHQKGNSFMWKKPILLTLAHASNVTQNSSFYQTLYNTSLRMYNRVNVLILDVDKHSHWSHAFVPRGYYSEVYGQSEKQYLNHYPRFCLIHSEDHHHAAFFPSVNDSPAYVTDEINVKQLETFVDEYLQNPSDVVLETEHF